MAGESRIYKVETPNGARLVRAQNRVQAVNHVARATIKGEVASQDDLIELVGAGVKVEDVGDEEAAPAGDGVEHPAQS